MWNYGLTSIIFESHVYKKLSAKFIDPFQLVTKVGKVGYTLEFPLDTKIRPTFHYSPLKKKLDFYIASIILLEDSHVLLEPKTVLDRKMFRGMGKLLLNFWSNDSESIWIDLF